MTLIKIKNYIDRQKFNRYCFYCPIVTIDIKIIQKKTSIMLIEIKYFEFVLI